MKLFSIILLVMGCIAIRQIHKVATKQSLHVLYAQNAERAQKIADDDR